MDRFILHRVRYALLSTLPESGEEPPDFAPLTLIISSPDATHLISRLYQDTQTLLTPCGLRAKSAWEEDLGESLSDEIWTYCCSQTRFVSSNYRHKLLHYKYIHRIYYTPAFLHKIHSDVLDNCPKCAREGADFAHLTWTCDVVRTYGWGYSATSR